MCAIRTKQIPGGGGGKTPASTGVVVQKVAEGKTSHHTRVMLENKNVVGGFFFLVYRCRIYVFAAGGYKKPNCYSTYLCGLRPFQLMMWVANIAHAGQISSLFIDPWSVVTCLAYRSCCRMICTVH